MTKREPDGDASVPDQRQESRTEALADSILRLAQVRAAAAVRNDFWQHFDSQTTTRAERILEAAVWQPHPGVGAPGEDAASAD